MFACVSVTVYTVAVSAILTFVTARTLVADFVLSSGCVLKLNERLNKLVWKLSGKLDLLSIIFVMMIKDETRILLSGAQFSKDHMIYHMIIIRLS